MDIKNINIEKKVTKNKTNIQCDETKCINMLYFENDFPEKKDMTSFINKKINSYKVQDKKKNRDIANNINLNETIELLVASKLKCCYCKKTMKIFYDNVRDEKQWTLDRVDNKLPHSKENVVVSCLSCNLKKRTRDHNKFKMSFIKIKKVI